MSADSSDLIDKISRIVKLVGKYASTSVIATSVDFTAFHFVLTRFSVSAVQATVAGRLAGAFVAFLLHRAWVFKTVDTPQYRGLILKYIGGIGLGMGLNVWVVWVLNTFLKVDAWSSRIIAAIAVWSLILLYNKHVVFKEKIIADQDFAEIEDEESNEIENIVV